jgi:prepilin-type N-terminal cleavage/methylation domain-containing protein
MMKKRLLRQTSIYKAVRGFTIIEVVVVLLITGIVFITASPLTGKAAACFNLRHTAFQMAEDIRELQQRALSESSHQYLIEFYPDHYIMKKSIHPVNIRIATVHLPNTIRVEHTNFPEDQIRFSEKGTPSPAGGSIKITDQATGKCKFVIIASITGRVRVSDKPPDH